MHIYCAGIGGIGLSAYAAYQRSCGHTVSGSDVRTSPLTDDLSSQGITIMTAQDGNALAEDVDLMVYTLALPEDHPERIKAASLGIPQQSYFEALGVLTRESGKKLIAICGTHGKSSTTAMAAHVLLRAGLDPSVILGTKMQDLEGRNWRKGGGKYFLVEACEYRRSFLHLQPDIVLMTNVTGDHFDAYIDMADYQDAFHAFLSSISKEGALITHMNRDDCRIASESAKCTVIDAGDISDITLQIPGEHMQQNAKLVGTLAQHIGISQTEDALLSAYTGCWRRTELKGTLTNGAIIIDDYGHHPNEIRSTLHGLKKAYADRRLVCIFQPHTHHRTLKLYDDFLTAFRSADLVIIPGVYEARSDRDSAKVNLQDLISGIAEHSACEVLYGESIENTVKILQKEIITEKDLIVTMGAGDIWKVADALFS